MLFFSAAVTSCHDRCHRAFQPIRLCEAPCRLELVQPASASEAHYEHSGPLYDTDTPMRFHFHSIHDHRFHNTYFRFSPLPHHSRTSIIVRNPLSSATTLFCCKLINHHRRCQSSHSNTPSNRNCSARAAARRQQSNIVGAGPPRSSCFPIFVRDVPQ